MNININYSDVKLVLLDQNIPVNSIAAPSYKYLFGPRSGIYLISQTSQ